MPHTSPTHPTLSSASLEPEHTLSSATAGSSRRPLLHHSQPMPALSITCRTLKAHLIGKDGPLHKQHPLRRGRGSRGTFSSGGARSAMAVGASIWLALPLRRLPALPLCPLLDSTLPVTLAFGSSSVGATLTYTARLALGPLCIPGLAGLFPPRASLLPGARLGLEGSRRHLGSSAPSALGSSGASSAEAAFSFPFSQHAAPLASSLDPSFLLFCEKQCSTVGRYPVSSTSHALCQPLTLTPPSQNVLWLCFRTWRLRGRQERGYNDTPPLPGTEAAGSLPSGSKWTQDVPYVAP